LDAVREGCSYSTTASRLYPIIRVGLLLISAYKHTEKFAAIAPMSAPMVITAWAPRVKDMPIWAFHGEKDDLFPVSGTQALIDTLKALGGVV
jgi:predicted peptidase